MKLSDGILTLYCLELFLLEDVVSCRRFKISLDESEVEFVLKIISFLNMN